MFCGMLKDASAVVAAVALLACRFWLRALCAFIDRSLPAPAIPVFAEVKALRTRWHPDRFANKFGQRLAPGERDEIMGRVTAVAARLNAQSLLQHASSAPTILTD